MQGVVHSNKSQLWRHHLHMGNTLRIFKPNGAVTADCEKMVNIYNTTTYDVGRIVTKS